MSNFEFRRDAEGKPLWHNPTLNPAFDPGRPYEPDNHPFSTCALCGENWPCTATVERTKPVEVTGIWLRSQSGGVLEVLAEMDSQWRVVIRQPYLDGDLLSNIVEPLGMRHAEAVPNE